MPSHDLRDDEAKHRFWNTAPHDPIRAARANNHPHYSRATKGVLFHQSAMPFGQYTGRIMTQVPAEFLLQVHQSWWGKKPKWAAVRDYTDRHLTEITERAKIEEAKRQANKKPESPCP